VRFRNVVLWLFAATLLPHFAAQSQVVINDPFLRLNARHNDPLFSTYAAAMSRSRFFADKAYFMDYFTSNRSIAYATQYGGEFSVIWKVNNVVVNRTRDFVKPPVVIASFPDMAVLEYEPFEGITVQEVFFVYSSGSAVIDLTIQHKGARPYDVALYPLLFLPEDSLRVIRYDSLLHAYVFEHHESLIRLHSNLYKDRGYPTEFRNVLASSMKPTSFGTATICRLDEFYFTVKRLSKVHENVRALNEQRSGSTKLAALQHSFVMKPGDKISIRFVRSVQDAARGEEEMIADAQEAMRADLQSFVEENVKLFKSVPRIKFRSDKERMVYLGAFNLVRQCMLPPSGKTSHNFYVFSREPVWGWGHGHQVMHESLSMIPYAYLDAASAQASQRVYIEQQYDDGLIAYRHGPRGPQVYPRKGIPTTSAPFFTWTNWEIFEVSKDRAFLKEAYDAGAKFIRYLEKERDKDGDGMFEWGPYGIIENVRDGWNVVFQLFSEGEDEGRDISHELDVLDLTAEAANEMYYLRLMATELRDTAGVREWTEKYNRTAALINKHMWDPEDGFYYNVAQSDNSLLFEGRSLKRKELIGFLPMWARVATKEQAARLVKHLTNERSFWRRYGVPTLAADDPHYTPFVDGCCRWNGPVWLLWDYMVFRGLLNYGYNDLALKLGDKMMLAVTTQLESNHRFWESFSPDYPVQESPSNYIWDSIMAKLLIDMYKLKASR